MPRDTEDQRLNCLQNSEQLRAGPGRTENQAASGCRSIRPPRGRGQTEPVTTGSHYCSCTSKVPVQTPDLLPSPQICVLWNTKQCPREGWFLRVREHLSSAYAFPHFICNIYVACPSAQTLHVQRDGAVDVCTHVHSCHHYGRFYV